MADEKNMEIKDEAMAKAAGGAHQIPGPKYEIGDKVQVKVTTSEGIAATVDGFIDDRRGTAAGWEYLVRYEVEQNVNEVWFPESAI